MTLLLNVCTKKEEEEGQDLNDEKDFDPIAVASATVPRGPTGQLALSKNSNHNYNP